MHYNFVIFSLSRWNINYGCNIKDISFELVRQGHRVLYLDVPLKRKERLFSKNEVHVQEVLERSRAKTSLIQVKPNLWHYISDEVLESVNSITNGFLFDKLNFINNRRMAKVIRRAVKEVGFDHYILLNDNDVYNGLHLKELLNPPLFVYYLRDMLSAFNYWKRHVSRLEPAIIQKADLVVANSEYLSAYAAKHNSSSYYVGQGCDVGHYLEKPDQIELDSVLGDISKPVVGYVGALNAERLDINLISEIAVKMPEVNIVLVGPEDDAFKTSHLHKLSNVFFLGKKEVVDLPKYIYAFDVSINPQVLNEITIGNYPRKVDEYLAAGVPVVATETHAMNPFRDYVYLGRTPDDYCALIKLAMEENSDEKIRQRKAFASLHTWENSVSQMIESIDKVKA